MRNNRHHRRERRTAALEKLHAPYAVRMEISPQAVDLARITQMLVRRNNPKGTDDTPRDNP